MQKQWENFIKSDKTKTYFGLLPVASLYQTLDRSNQNKPGDLSGLQMLFWIVGKVTVLEDQYWYEFYNQWANQLETK